MPFQPGQSGNPGGRAKDKIFRAALDRAIAQDDGKKVRAAAEKLLELAVAGEAWAMQMLAERTDGKVAQAHEHTGPDGEPIRLVIGQ